LRETAGKLKSLRVQRAIKLCERTKIRGDTTRARSSKKSWRSGPPIAVKLLTMAGTSPSLSKSPKRNKQGNRDNHDNGSKRTPTKSKNDDAKSKKDDTTSKTGAETSILTETDANDYVKTHTASPIRPGDEHPNKEMELSLKSKEAEGSNMQVLESTVCKKKKQYFPFWKILFILTIL
jgi:hypothetical protein